MPMIIPIDMSAIHTGHENHIRAQLGDCRVRQFSRGEDYCELFAGDTCNRRWWVQWEPGHRPPQHPDSPSQHKHQLDSVALWVSASLWWSFSSAPTYKYLSSFLLFDLLILEMKGYPIWLKTRKDPYDHHSKLATVDISLYLPSEANKTLHSPFQLETPWLPFPKLLSKGKNTQWWVPFHSMFYTLNNNQNRIYVCFIYIKGARVYISFFNF